MTTGKFRLCGEAACPICRFHQSLESKGAVPQRDGISFRESNYSIKISLKMNVNA